MKMQKPLDLVCAAAVVLAALCSALPLFFRESGAEAVVSWSGGEFSVPLDKDSSRTIRSNGFTVTIKIKDGAAEFDADCPDRQCTRLKASESGDTIICVPSGIILRVVPEKEKNEAKQEIDATAG